MDWSIKGKRMDGLDYNITRINGTDDFAGIAAGAISWSGIADIGFSDRQWRMYPQGTPWSPDHKANTTEIQDIIMRHTIRAIAAFDDHGIPYNIHINDRNCDKKSQRLNVGWRWIAVILGSIILIQLVALCYLLAIANRTIIRDASHFSTAMLLKPVLKDLDGESEVMAMSGAELKSHPKLQGRKIWYDYIEGRPGEAKEVTVSFEDEIKGHKRKNWGSGEYR